MPIFSTEQDSTPNVLQAYTTPLGDVMKESISESFSDNPATKLYDYGRANFVAESLRNPKTLSRAEVEERAKADGVSLEIPESGMREDVANILIERQYQKRRRADALESSESGFVAGATKIAGGLAGGLVDPLNIATAFIPVVGEARIAAMMGKTSGFFGRTAVRAGVGAVEGAVGAAVVEPLNYGLSQKLQDDYGFSNSMLNIAFGTAMGAGLHMGAGAIGDAIKMGKAPEMAGPKGRFAEGASKMSPELRQESLTAALAQGLEDRPISIELVRQKHVEELQTKITKVESQIKARLAADDLEGAKALTERRSELAATLNNEIAPERTGSAEVTTARAATVEDVRVLNEETVRGESAQPVDAARQKELIHEEVKAAIDSGSDVHMKDGDTRVQVAKITDEGKLLDKNGNVVGDVAALKEGKQVEIANTVDPFSPLPDSIASRAIDPEAKTKALFDAKTQPGARFINKEVTDAHAAEISEMVPETRVEEATAQMNEAMTSLKETADNIGIPEEVLAREMKGADELAAKSKEFTKSARALALCKMRRG